MKAKRNKNARPGAALLVVLFIVMAVTILSLGFLSRSDVELACGENMILKTQMDYLAESGLEHAKGLILNPQEVASEYWTGAVGQQLVDGSDDYYDVTVQRGDPTSGVTYKCSYEVTCEAYRLKSGEKIGRSSLKAHLRLDPCIAYWAAGDTIISSNTTINGDVYCGAQLTNNGVINGDVFAVGLSGSGTKSGRLYGTDKAAGVTSPGLDIGDFTLTYIPDSNGNVELIDESLVITGALVVDGNLIIDGGTVEITAGKNSPALLVGGQLVLENAAALRVNGLAQIEAGISVAGGTEVEISGALFIVGSGAVNGNGIVIITADSIKASLRIGPEGLQENWSPAGCAFFRSVERK